MLIWICFILVVALFYGFVVYVRFAVYVVFWGWVFWDGLFYFTLVGCFDDFVWLLIGGLICCLLSMDTFDFG